MRHRLTSLILFASIAFPAEATTIYKSESFTIPVYTGTGFYVSKDHIVTNQHVIDQCREVSLRGAVPESKGKVVAVDMKYDLALIKAEQQVRKPAPLRELRISGLEVNEPVMVMGYPKETWETGKYAIVESTVVGLKGPLGDPDYIQFARSARKGNSGGPLLDSAGNVTGVIVGNATLYEENVQTGQRRVVNESDLAISLGVLAQFLEANRVDYRINAGQGYMMAHRIEEDAKDYIVNIICERPDLRKSR